MSRIPVVARLQGSLVSVCSALLSSWAWRLSEFLGRQPSVLIVCFSLLWFLPTLGLYPLLIPDEGRYVGVAWYMTQSGDFWVPRLDGLPYFHKPPLFYWLTALAIKLFGHNFFAARFVSALMASLLIASMHAFCKKYQSNQVAGLSTVFLAVTPFLFGGAHYANLDMTIGALLLITVLVAAHSVMCYEAGQAYKRSLCIAYVLLGLGFLAKGLIGIVLPAGVMFFWLVGRWRWDSLRRLFYVPGMLLMLAVALPWMLSMQSRYAGFFDYYIVYQHFRRFLESGFNNVNPFWFYAVVLPLACLPFSVFLGVRLRAIRARSLLGPVQGLMLALLLTVVIFFSLPSSKLVGYVLPAVAPFIYFMVEGYQYWAQQRSAEKAQRCLSILTLIGFGLCTVAVLVMMLWPQASSLKLAKIINAERQATDQLVYVGMYRFDLNFYLDSRMATIAVGNWAELGLQRVDTWRQELYDAAQFEPTRSDMRLMEKAAFGAYLCQLEQTGNYWLLSSQRDGDQPSWLAMLSSYQDKGAVLYHMDAKQRQAICAQRPIDGLE